MFYTQQQIPTFAATKQPEYGTAKFQRKKSRNGRNVHRFGIFCGVMFL